MSYTNKIAKIEYDIKSGKAPSTEHYLDVIAGFPTPINLEKLKSFSYLADELKAVRDGVDFCMKELDIRISCSTNAKYYGFNSISSSITQSNLGLKYKEPNSESIIDYQDEEKYRLIILYSKLYNDLQILRKMLKKESGVSSNNNDSERKSVLTSIDRIINLNIARDELFEVSDGSVHEFYAGCSASITFKEIYLKVLENYDLTRVDFEIMIPDENAAELLRILVIKAYIKFFSKNSQGKLNKYLNDFGFEKVDACKTSRKLIKLFYFSNLIPFVTKEGGIEELLNTIKISEEVI